MHVRAPMGTRIEQTGALCDRIEAKIREILPKGSLASIVDNIGLPVSGINMSYNNSGTIGATDADLMITFDPDRISNSNPMMELLREKLPREFPGVTFAMLPADIVTQILNFGLPAPLDIQATGVKRAENRAYIEKIFERLSRVPGIADPRIQQAENLPTLFVDVDRTLAQEVGLSAKDVTLALQTPLAGSFQSAPNFWLDTRSGVSYPIVAMVPQYWLTDLEALYNLPIFTGNPPQLLGGVATLRRGWSAGVVTHYNAQPSFDIYAGVRESDLGAVADDVQAILEETRQGSAGGLDNRAARSVCDDAHRLYQSVAWTGARRAVRLFGDRRELPVVARPLPDRLRPADGFRRHCLDVVSYRHDAIRAGANRRHHVHGRRHRQQQSDRRLRARAARRGRRTHSRGGGGGGDPFSPGSDDGAGDDHRNGADGALRGTKRPAGTRGDRRVGVRHHRHAASAAGAHQPGARIFERGARRKDRPMSHYDPAHMPPPDPEAQAALARKARRWLIGLALFALALAIWGVVSRRARDVDLAKLTLEAATPTVELVTPQVSTAVQELILPANVEAFYDAPIYARVNGYLKSWAHDIGDRVKAGEVLAVIDAPDLDQQVEQAKGELGLSVAQAGLASITAKRWTTLRDQNAVSLQSTDEKTHDLTAKSSAAAAAKANLDHLNALKSFLTLVAPFDGVVTARNTDIGALIDAGVGKRDLFRVADIHKMRIYTQRAAEPMPRK